MNINSEVQMKIFSLCIASLSLMGSLVGIPTPDFQKVGTANITFSSLGQFETTVGAMDYENFKADVGVGCDIVNGTTAGLQAKIGQDEGIYNQYAPSWNIGISGAGIRTKHEILQHENVIHAMIGHSLGSFANARVYTGAFHGTRVMGENRTGYFVGYTHYYSPVLYDVNTTYNKAQLDLLYVSGKSNLGGSSMMIKYFLNPRTSIQTGPKWYFQNKRISSKNWSFERMKWIVNLSIDV